MARIQRTYESVVRGVSQQVPQDRREGQMWEQVNFISDPVRGLVRRRGSINKDEMDLGPYSAGAWDALCDAHRASRSMEVSISDGDYIITYPTKAGAGEILCQDKDTKQFMPVVSGPGDTLVNTLMSGGVSAAVHVGKYIFFAGNTITPDFTVQDVWEGGNNPYRTVVWIRGGAYSRTYTVRFKRQNGNEHTVEHTTLASSYPGELDTSDISFDDDDYTKKVNDRVNAYNSAVTQWIGEAAESIQPENIAEALRVKINAISGVTAQRSGSHLRFTDGSQVISVNVDDGGDGSQIRAVAQEVTNVDLVSQRHVVGKVVRVQPQRSGRNESIYLRAFPKIPGETGFVEVIWREAAGEIQTPIDCLVYGTVHEGTLYLAGSASRLNNLVPDDHPQFISSRCGDREGLEPPYLFGRQITYLGLFQDRMVVGAGAVLLFSRPGDYLNWYRDSMLTLADDDPVEVFSLGAEADTVRHSVMYDRNLVLFGDRRQYIVPGRSPITPTTTTVSVSASYEDTTAAPPVAVGNLVFYSTATPGKRTTLSQIQMGVLQDTPESVDISQQLDAYIIGTPVQLVGTSGPNFVILRTEEIRDGFYVYTYVDSPAGEQRLFDSWSRWEWEEKTGQLVSMHLSGSEINVILLRHDGDRIYLVSDSFSLETFDLSFPCLDSMRPYVSGTPQLGSITLEDELVGVAFGVNSEKFLLGTTGDRVGELVESYGEEELENHAWVGFECPAYFQPTNPYLRDRNERAELAGRLTISKFTLAVDETGGFDSFTEYRGNVAQNTGFSARTLNLPSSTLGIQPLSSGNVTIPIGKETREFRLTITSKRWLPVTITSLQWTGQSFRRR